MLDDGCKVVHWAWGIHGIDVRFGSQAFYIPSVEGEKRNEFSRSQVHSSGSDMDSAIGHRSERDRQDDYLD